MSLRNFSLNFGGVTRQENTLGVSPAVLAEIVKQHGEHSELQQKEIARLADALELKNGQMRAALEILNQADIPPEKYGAKLIEIAEHLTTLRTSTVANSNDTVEIEGLKTRAREAIEAGDLASADELFSQIGARQTAAYAETLAQRGEIALARLRYREAAGHFANAAADVTQTEDYLDAQLNYLSKEAAALYKQGDEFGDNASLLLSIERNRSLLERQARARFPLDWALVQNNLGNALATLGLRERGRERLEEAVTAYEAALEELTRERVPVGWAITQNNRGIAFAALGEREDRTEQLTKAVQAHRGALNVFSRERFSLDWARTQSNLGNTLQKLGERESGTGRLKEAVTAYEAALEELTRERVPLLWAASVGGHGVALMVIAERTNDAEIAEDAVQKIDAAFQTTRGHPFSRYFEPKLTKAKAILDRLKTKRQMK
jgi:tetratricopeptide (TPR) repeat protein